MSKFNPASPAQSLANISEPDKSDRPETLSRLERMAHQVAAQHVIDPQPADHARRHVELPRLMQKLQEAHRRLVNRSAQELTLTNAAEWLLDSHYMVVQSLRQIEEDLPESYYRQLPKLSVESPVSGHFHPGLPRIYAAAHAFWTHEEYQLEPHRLIRFVAAYQEVHAFTMGELWAVPTMLRLALLETLAEVAGRLTCPTKDTAVTSSEPPVSDSPAVPNDPTALNDTDLVANCVLSLRRLNSQDWTHFFEAVSLVQQILSKESVGIYTRMDFASRNRYRDVVEVLARTTGQHETIIAQKGD